ncbi:VOC family protein [Nocardiopsis ansamitocini]|uniref:VOC domain-containing protein n=1 Tax=Nocardiopsis ansamitocini TaxID=1670832 RepID=A0A9W6P900_9ACTN|nr:VOC family protein [Nocardiopsis ansamitocini]GLU49183.1 hypothetical protein Nans01_35340 [Nocardiopsis ansamitocini]
MLVFRRVAAVMVVADDPDVSARWWADVLGVTVHRDVAPHGAVYAWIELGGVEYGFHPADDERNPRGASPVVYWAVEGDLEQALESLLAVGCTRHRGPLDVRPGRRIAQIVDPFGTVIGIEGR